MDHPNDQYSSFGKRPLAIAAMNAELPAFKNGGHNSESAYTLDRNTPSFNEKAQWWQLNLGLNPEDGELPL